MLDAKYMELFRLVSTERFLIQNSYQKHLYPPT